jgi:hypothetical protein
MTQPRDPHNPQIITEPLTQPDVFRRFDALGAQGLSRHARRVIVPGSQLDPWWLQVAQQLIHMPPRQKAREGRAAMRHYCDQVIGYLRGRKGYNKLLMEIGRIRKEWG